MDRMADRRERVSSALLPTRLTTTQMVRLAEALERRHSESDDNPALWREWHAGGSVGDNDIRKPDHDEALQPEWIAGGNDDAVQ